MKQLPIELNNNGLLIFQNDAIKQLFAHRAYRWVDRIIFIDESNGRRHIHEQTYSSFKSACWTPITQEEHDSVKNTYNELNTTGRKGG